MRILLISTLFEQGKLIPGGISLWTKRFIESTQVRECHQVQIVNTNLIGKRALGRTSYSYFQEARRTLRILYKLILNLRDNKPDIVHLNSNCSNLGLIRDCFEAYLIKKKEVPYVVHMRCDVSHYSYSKISYIALKYLVKNATNVLCLNTSSIRYIYTQFGINSLFLPNFVSLEFQNRKFELQGKINKICFVGHITKQKGCGIIIEVAKKLPSIQFKLAGPIMDTALMKENLENVDFLGNISHEEIWNLLCTSDLFIFPSFTEGFPNAVLEAMSCGLPIIASSVGAIPDMIGINGEGGILINSNNPIDYIKTIRVLENDYNMRLKMSRRNKDEVLKKYTEEVVVTQMLDVYRESIIIGKK